MARLIVNLPSEMILFKPEVILTVSVSTGKQLSLIIFKASLIANIGQGDDLSRLTGSSLTDVVLPPYENTVIFQVPSVIS